MVEKWRKKRLKSLIISTAFVCVFIFSGVLEKGKSNIFFVGIYLIFIFSIVSVFLEYLRSAKWQIQKFSYAMVVEKYHGKNERTAIAISVDDKNFIVKNGIVDYEKFNVGDIVLAFTVGDGNIYIALK